MKEKGTNMSVQTHRIIRRVLWSLIIALSAAYAFYFSTANYLASEVNAAAHASGGYPTAQDAKDLCQCERMPPRNAPTIPTNSSAHPQRNA
jgi:hypothetical protein